jgi:hypothetical protein
MIKYLDMSYDAKLNYWKSCTEDLRLKMKIEHYAKELRERILGYKVNNRRIYITESDCYTYILQNGGFFKHAWKYTSGLLRLHLELCGIDIMPFHDCNTSSTKYMYLTGEVVNVISCWSDKLSLVETFYSNEALMTSGQDVRLKYDQGDTLYCELYEELSSNFETVKYDP